MCSMVSSWSTCAKPSRQSWIVTWGGKVRLNFARFTRLILQAVAWLQQSAPRTPATHLEAHRSTVDPDHQAALHSSISACFQTVGALLCECELTSEVRTLLSPIRSCGAPAPHRIAYAILHDQPVVPRSAGPTLQKRWRQGIGPA